MSLLSFYFNKNDPNFKSDEIVVEESPYIGHWFISCPIYDDDNNRIGYKATDDYIQQVDVDKYLVRYNNTYFIDGKGTISWEYASVNNSPNPYYPLGTVAKARITSGTGCFFSAKGFVSLTPRADGRRDVIVCYE